MASRSFGSEQPDRPHLVTDGKGGVAGEVGDLRSDVDAGFEALETEISSGSPASTTLLQGGQPTATNTIDIGADTYEFDGTGTNINVTIAGSAEGTLDNLLAAAVAYGTEALYWDKLDATHLRLRNADAPQGNLLAGEQDIAIDCSGATNWSCEAGDVNMNTLGGSDAGTADMASTTLTITTAMITATTARVSFTFTPRVVQFSAYTSAGVVKAFTADAVNISGDDVVLTLGTDLANTDVVHITAFA